MFIDTLEFTIPIDLCSLYATLQQEARSQLEFPASVNSYGTTQDANVQVALRANKVTFKVDGVSSNASIISKSECRTLKLSVFDVDRTLMQKNVEFNNSNNVQVHHSPPVSNPAKRLLEQSVSLPPAKSSRTSYSESPRPRSPAHRRSQPLPPSPRSTENSHSRTHSDTPVNVKQEPEDPDLIEIEPDPEPDDVIPKKEAPYMQIDYSSDVPHTQTSQAALDRLSFPPTSRSHSSSSSFHQNVPHVPDYSEPGPSQSHHGDQSADDFLVFQDDNEYGEENEETEYSNDDYHGSGEGYLQAGSAGPSYQPLSAYITSQGYQCRPSLASDQSERKLFPCSQCDKVFNRKLGLKYHIQAIHQNHQGSGSGPSFRVPWMGLPREGVSGSENYPDSSNPLEYTQFYPQDYARGKSVKCPQCYKMFSNTWGLNYHIRAIHEKVMYQCVCGKSYKYPPGLGHHQKSCSVYAKTYCKAASDG